MWRYLADLRSIAEWDPSVEVRLVSGEPGTVGARYELDVSFLGRTITLPYETVKAEPPHRVVFAPRPTPSRSATRPGSACSTAGGAVTWDADLRLEGPRRILDLPLRAAFNRLGPAPRTVSPSG